MRVAVLLNAGAGTMARLGPEGPSRVEAAFVEAGVDATVEVLASQAMSGRIDELVAERERLGLDGLVVGGGDGTIGCAAARMAGTGMALGVLPLGTLNHFAKDLKLPLELEAAAGVIAGGHVAAVDVAECNGHVFVNNSSVGIYPFLVAERDAERRRHGIGKLAALVPALITTFRSSSWHRVTVRAGADARSLNTPCVFVGNNLYDVRALGVRQRIDQGLLCVYLVKPQSWAGLIMLPFKIALGLAHPARDVELLTVEHVELGSNREALRVALDGETLRLAPPLVYRSRPGDLTVFVAPEAPG
jgi:diacylglycerol kinase family enzyme